jgi:hypothetical protein
MEINISNRKTQWLAIDFESILQSILRAKNENEIRPHLVV